jgi:hypothetical protein
MLTKNGGNVIKKMPCFSLFTWTFKEVNWNTISSRCIKQYPNLYPHPILSFFSFFHVIKVFKIYTHVQISNTRHDYYNAVSEGS